MQKKWFNKISLLFKNDKSFVLVEKPKDFYRNRLIIFGFLIFIFIVSYIVYGSVSYGLSKLNLDYVSVNTNVDNIKFVHTKTLKVSCGSDFQFTSYFAGNEADREKGLSIFDNIKEDQSMLFVFESPQKYSFWMKDMKFPIDIIWLDQNKQIVDIKEGASVDTYPEVFTPKEDSLYVLEIKAGVAEKMKIKIGDSCDFDFSAFK